MTKEHKAGYHYTVTEDNGIVSIEYNPHDDSTSVPVSMEYMDYTGHSNTTTCTLDDSITTKTLPLTDALEIGQVLAKLTKGASTVGLEDQTIGNINLTQCGRVTIFACVPEQDTHPFTLGICEAIGLGQILRELGTKEPTNDQKAM